MYALMDMSLADTLRSTKLFLQEFESSFKTIF